MQYNVILIRYGELALKQKKTRMRFEQTLMRNISQALTTTDCSYRIVRDWGRIYVYTREVDQCLSVIQRIFGVVSLSPALLVKGTISDLNPVVIDIAHRLITPKKSFALRVTRTGAHEFSSQDAAIELGNAVVHATGAPVDLTNPAVEIHIDIRDEKAFVFTESFKGVGGLPLGTQGTVLSLIDSKFSLLAAWYLMKRGCEVVFVVTDDREFSTVQKFAFEWHAQPLIHVLHSTEETMGNDLKQVTEDYKCDALVLGATLQQKEHKDLTFVRRLKAALTLPILLPLIAMTDDEIQENCHKIGVL